MSIEKFVEDQISRAMAQGEFDNLSGNGKPLDLDGYFQTPEHLRICYSILKNGDFVPEEVQMLKEIESLKEKFVVCSNQTQKDRIAKSINEKMLSFNLAIERNKRNK